MTASIFSMDFFRLHKFSYTLVIMNNPSHYNYDLHKIRTPVIETIVTSRKIYLS